MGETSGKIMRDSSRLSLDVLQFMMNTEGRQMQAGRSISGAYDGVSRNKTRTRNCTSYVSEETATLRSYHAFEQKQHHTGKSAFT